MPRCSLHSREQANPKCDMCVEFYGTTAALSPLELLNLVPDERITTLPNVPGYQIVRSCGIVTALESNSGWTASTKGNVALERALPLIREQTARLGGNAIVGLTITAFGAAGGLTSVVGGDAVGVALMGTAVLVDIANSD